MRSFVLAAAVLAGAGTWPIAGAAQESFPTGPITWVVPFTAGGPTDALARSIAHQISQDLGQNVLIENVAGAGGTLGAARVARADANGYTFLVGHVGYMAAAPAMYEELPYDPLDDFAAVFRFPDTPLVLLAGPDSPFETAADLVAFARENPGELTFSNAGVGSTSHLVAALFAAEAGIDAEPIPYQGAGPALNDLMGGAVDAMFDQTNTALPQVRSGMVKALGVTSAAPNEQFPGVEPVGERAIPGFEAATWYGVYAPAGTPEIAITTLHEAYLRVMQNAEYTEQLASQGIVLLSEEEYGPEAFRQHTESEIGRWAEVVEQAGISLQ